MCIGLVTQYNITYHGRVYLDMPTGLAIYKLYHPNQISTIDVSTELHSGFPPRGYWGAGVLMPFGRLYQGKKKNCREFIHSHL